MNKINSLEKLISLGAEIKKNFPDMRVLAYGDLVLIERGERPANDPPMAELAVVSEEQLVTQGLKKEREIVMKVEEMGFVVRDSSHAGVMDIRGDLSIVWVREDYLIHNRTFLAGEINKAKVDIE